MIYLRFVKRDETSKARNLSYECQNLKLKNIMKLVTVIMRYYLCMGHIAANGDNNRKSKLWAKKSKLDPKLTVTVFKQNRVVSDDVQPAGGCWHPHS